MKIVGTIERMKTNEDKKIVEIILVTTEEIPNYLSITYFIREGRTFPKVKSGDMIVAEVKLSGRRWIDPETGEAKYFMSLIAKKIIFIEEDNNEN